MHEVTLSPFLIATCEVTQAEWKRVMGLTPSGFKGDDLPVEKVSWNDCQAFCRKTGLKLPTENGMRRPIRLTQCYSACN